MSSRYFATLTAVVFSLMLFLPLKAFSQIIKPTGNFSRQSSQLIYVYDNIDSSNSEYLQVTNTNDTESVWVHVQIFRNFNVTSSPLVNVICDERDFVDFLTPNDTHVYELGDVNFTKNIGETETMAGESTSIDATGTEGFVIITPVVSESDFSAISFQYLIGTAEVGSDDGWMNAMGRDAVDFTTGEIVEDNTVLDGITNGFVVLQPDELLFNILQDGPVALQSVVFQDSYGPAGLLGYQALPASASWTSFIFDFKEDPTSCGNKTIQCYADLGIEEVNFEQDNTELGDNLLCNGVDIPETQDNGSGTGDRYAWVRIFVSGLGDYVNHIAAFRNDYETFDVDDTVWMYTK